MTRLGDDECRITVCGKEIKLDGEHIADCRDDETAHVIALMLAEGMLSCRSRPEDVQLVMEFFA